MPSTKRERWTEEEILSLPKGEQDFFERKSGAIISKSSLDDDSAKAFCAFANSGGGHVIIGVSDDGIIDGAPEISKGRARTKDWLEQKIPRLLNYPLQDFRVHEVEPSDPTTIPAGRIVLVIDVGDSPLAPHQTAITRTYYYRPGGRSEIAPHFLLDLLWGRKTRYPGQKIARAWLDVITSLLAQLYYQRDHIDRGRRSWDRVDRDEKRLVPLGVDASISWPNLEQFLEFYPEVAELARRHRKEVSEVREAMGALFDALVEQRRSLKLAYDASMSLTRRERLFEELKHYRSVSSSSEEEIPRALFGSFGPEHPFAILANHIVNRSGELSSEDLVAPLWNTEGERFLAILSRRPFCRLEDKINSALLSLRRTIDELYAALEEKRREIATQFGEPYTATNRPS